MAEVEDNEREPGETPAGTSLASEINDSALEVSPGPEGSSLLGIPSEAALENTEATQKWDETPDPKRWLLFGIVATAVMMGSLDQTVVATALPTLHHDLHAPVNWTAWTITIYQLGLVVGLPVAGRLSDQFGRKKLFLICIVIFAFSSLACGSAPNIEWLIVFRAIQAIGTSGLMPSAAGVVSDHFGRDRDRGIGFFASVVPIGSFTGPLLGGTIISYWSWRGVFLINFPIAIIIFFMAVKYIPRSTPKETSRADYLGIALVAGTILPFILGITDFGSGNTPIYSPKVLGPIALAIVMGFILVRHMSQMDEPIIPVRLLAHRAFGTMNILNCIYGGCSLGIGALIPLYGEDRYHFIPVEAGSVVSARAVGILAFSGIATLMLRRVGYRRPMLLGQGLAAIAMALIGIGNLGGIGPYAWLMLSGGLLGIGAGISQPATNNAILNLAPKDVASITGIRGMFRQLGAIISISIVSTFVSRSAHPGMALGEAFVIFAILIAVVVAPLVMMVPDHRGRW